MPLLSLWERRCRSTFENMNTQSNDNVGKRFGRWTVISLSNPRRPRGLYLCRCDCGTEKGCQIWHLEKGTTLMCDKHIRERNMTHGKKGTRVYKTWDSMKQRCYNSRHKSYADYGGRGIIICERWLHSFENFLDDMGEPKHGETIDRIDGNGGYSPDNCRWATWTEQANNKRGNTILSAFGESKTMAQWARDTRCLVDISTLVWRISIAKKSWSHEAAIVTPPRKLTSYFRLGKTKIENKAPRLERFNSSGKKATVWRAV